MIERLAPEKLSAEIDDEPVTEQELRDIEAGREWFIHNKGTPFEQVVAELGFTMEEVTNYREACEEKTPT